MEDQTHSTLKTEKTDLASSTDEVQANQPEFMGQLITPFPDVAKMGNISVCPPPQAPQNLGELGCRAVAKQFKKMMRYEVAVLKDKDIEDLHQMRINLRRLRTTLRTFGPVLELPSTIQDQAVKPLAKRLGRVRDLDVLLATLRDRYQPTLPNNEQKGVERVLQQLDQDRDRQFKRMKQFLRSAECADMKRAFKVWVKQPPCQHKFNHTGELAVAIALPDLLLPVLSQTFLHPGWLALPNLDVVQNGTHPFVDSKQNRNKLNNWLNHEGTLLHDLRKQMKHLRYQADFFAPYYGDTYRAYTREFKTIQAVLGRLQDAWVLGQTLTRCQGKSWAKRLPTLAQQIAQEQWDTWHEWVAIRQTYLTVEGRSQFRSIILSPQIVVGHRIVGHRIE